MIIEGEPSLKKIAMFIEIKNRFFLALNQIKNIESPLEKNRTLSSFKESALKDFPEDNDLIESIFGLIEFIETEQRLTKLRQGKETIEQKEQEIIELKKKLVRWQLALARVLIKTQDRQFAENLWYNLDNISKRISGKGLGAKRLGIIGQVGVYKTLEKIGLNPLMAEPEEDVVEKIDLIVPLSKGKMAAIQVKYSDKLKGFGVREVNEIKYPSVRILSSNQELNFASFDINGMLHLKERCHERSKMIGKTVRGFYVFCTSGIFDPYTGEPRQDFIKECEKIFKEFTQ